MIEEPEFDPEVAELKQAYEELFKAMGGVQCEFKKGVELLRWIICPISRPG